MQVTGAERLPAPSQLLGKQLGEEKMLQLLITTSDVFLPQNPSPGTSEQQAAGAEGQVRQRVRNGGEAQTRLEGMLRAILASGTLPVPKESLGITDVQRLKLLVRSVRRSGLHTKQVLRLGTCGGSQPTPKHQKRGEGCAQTAPPRRAKVWPAPGRAGGCTPAGAAEPTALRLGGDPRNKDDPGKGEGDAVGAPL